MSSQHSNLHANPRVTQLGVAGAGTMGSGIALAALLADIPVVLYEPALPVLDRVREYIQEHLQRKRKAISIKYLKLTSTLEDLAGCQVVIEAITEDLALKQELFARLDSICPPPAVLATNTSTLSVTAIAAAVSDPARVAGMHFFNPAPVLPLVEVVSGARSSPAAVQILVRLAEHLGKTPVIARDTPGFIVNRVARPFYGEALRLLGEGVASHEQIDQIVRQGGGFRMGPFELMDLIGIDINFTATQSIYEQTFQEPRYRPHLIQAQKVAQGALGRKSGRGFYRYRDGKPEVTTGPAASVSPPPASGTVYFQPGSYAPGLEALLCDKRFNPLPLHHAGGNQPIAGIAAASRFEDLQAAVVELDQRLPAGLPLLCQCADVTLAEVASWIERPARLAGFDGLFLAGGAIATLVAGPELSQPARQAAEALFMALGRPPVWIEDSPALVLPRLVSCLVNEAAFAVGEGVASPEMIDLAMQLGTNYPQGPVSWGEALGFERVLAVLDHLRAEYGEERYRPAPLLKRWARLGIRQA
jgi:3-hydroxybutyryl-CoA dehydrogenase